MPILTIVAMTIGCGLLVGWLGRRALKNGKAGMVAGAVLGVMLSFFGPVRRAIEGPPPRPQLTIDVPTNFKRQLVILITDPSVDTEIQWDDWTNEARITAPKSGIVRLKSLGRLDNQLTYAQLSTGKTNCALSNRNFRGARLVAYSFNYDPAAEPEIGLLSENELAELIRKREAE